VTAALTFIVIPAKAGLQRQANLAVTTRWWKFKHPLLLTLWYLRCERCSVPDHAEVSKHDRNLGCGGYFL